jgi:hypothetical protein
LIFECLRYAIWGSYLCLIKSRYSNQSGIAHIAAVLVLVVFVGVGFAGWRVYDRSMQSATGAVTDLVTGMKLDDKAPKKLKISVKEKGSLVLPNGHADPTIAKTGDGYRMYVNRQSGGPGGILAYTSKDGVKWDKETDIIIPMASTSRAVVLPQGVRIYYPGPQPIRDSDPQADMFSSSSTDGVTFTRDPGTVLSPRSAAYYVEGPTVFQLPDGTWRMYFNENTVAAKMQRDGEIWGASSKDGLSWTRDDAVTMQAGEVESTMGVNKAPWKQILHPFVLKNPKGGYVMFYNSHSEMYAATSVDGITWDRIGKIGIHGADMDGYFQEDGTIRVFYGDYSPETGGLVYSAVLSVE